MIVPLAAWAKLMATLGVLAKRNGGSLELSQEELRHFSPASLEESGAVLRYVWTSDGVSVTWTGPLQ